MRTPRLFFLSDNPLCGTIITNHYDTTASESHSVYAISLITALNVYGVSGPYVLTKRIRRAVS
jgi:hypothetical protein